jgi:hypothetical protein
MPVLEDVSVPQPEVAANGRRWSTGAILLTVFSIAATAAAWRIVERPADAPAAPVVQTVPAAGLSASLRSESGALTHGRDRFWIEFRDPQGRLVDAGDVRLGATMAMPGMVMSGGVDVVPTSVRGRYLASAEFAMAGVWQMTLQWSSPAAGSVTFQGNVQ